MSQASIAIIVFTAVVSFCEATTAQISINGGDCSCAVTDRPNRSAHVNFDGARGDMDVPARFHSRIVNADIANSDAWPWFVSVQTWNGQHFCGGSLIRRDIVITAAHCLFDRRGRPLSARNLRVVVGEYDLDFRGNNERVAWLDDYEVHPQYNPRGNAHDVAILRLQSCLPMGYPTIRLDDRSAEALFNDFENSEGDNAGIAAIMGLGALESGGGAPRVLQEGRQIVLPHDTCAEEFRKYTRYTVDEESMICGGIENVGNIGDGVNFVDTCQGDSGGPFVTRDPRYTGEWVLTGITSWGVGCAELTPGVYARVSTYKDWLIDNLGSECNPPPPPTPAPYIFDIGCGKTVKGNTKAGLQTGFHSSKEHHFKLSVPSGGGRYVFSTCNKDTDFDTVIHVVKESDPSVSFFTNDDAWRCGLQSRVSVTLRQGNYLVIVEGYRGNFGDYALTKTCLP